MNRIYNVCIKNELLTIIRAELAGVAQPGQSVRLIIERSRAQIPPPAFFLILILNLCNIYHNIYNIYL